MRKEYQMSERQLEKIKAEYDSYLKGQSVPFNQEWISLGNEMGFDGMTVGPSFEKASLFFTAEPVEK